MLQSDLSIYVVYNEFVFMAKNKHFEKTKDKIFLKNLLVMVQARSQPP